MNGTNQQIKTLIFKGFVGLLLFINALLTFVFGGTYGASTFPTSIPIVSYILGGLMLTIFYDFAAFAWFIARSKENTSTLQRALASVLAIASMIASTLVSGTQLAMTTTLVDLSGWYAGIGIFGLFMAVFMAGAHFLGYFAFQYFDPDYAEHDAEAGFKAQVRDFRLTKKQEMLDKVQTKAEELLNNEMDAMAQGEAETLYAMLRSHLYTAPALPSNTAVQQPIVIENEAVQKPAQTPTGTPRKDGFYTVEIGDVQMYESPDLSSAQEMCNILAGRNAGRVVRLIDPQGIAIGHHKVNNSTPLHNAPRQESINHANGSGNAKN